MRRRPTDGSTANGAKPAPGGTSLAAAAKRLVKKHGKDRNTEVRKISSHLSLANVWSATQWRAERDAVEGPLAALAARPEHYWLLPQHYT